MILSENNIGNLGDNTQNSSKKPTLVESGKHMKNVLLYGFIKSYGLIPINLISTILVSRALEVEYWATLLYGLVLISGSQIFLDLIPPSINSYIMYKIPELIVLDKKSKVKMIMQSLLKIKFITGSITTGLYFIVGFSMWKLIDPFYIGEIDSVKLGLTLALLSPMILIGELRLLYLSLIFAFKKFKTHTILIFIERITMLIGYIFVFLIEMTPLSELICLSIFNMLAILSNMPPLIIFFVRKFKGLTGEKVKYDEIKSMSKFGLNYTISNSIFTAYNQSYIGFLNRYGVLIFNVYENICSHINYQATGILTFSNASVLSDLESTNQKDKALYLFKKTLNVYLVFTSLIILILYFFINLYVKIMYPPIYWGVVDIARIFTFSVFFIAIINNFESYFSISHNEKSMAIMRSLVYIISILFAFIGMFFYSYQGLVISKIITYCFLSIIYWYFAKKKVKFFDISLIYILRTLFAVVFCIIISQSIYNFFGIDDAGMSIYQWLNNVSINLFNTTLIGSYFYDWSVDMLWNLGFEFIVKALIGIGIFILYLIICKIIVKEDVERLEKIGIKIPFKNLIFKVSKKILRSEK